MGQKGTERGTDFYGATTEYIQNHMAKLLCHELREYMYILLPHTHLHASSIACVKLSKTYFWSVLDGALARYICVTALLKTQSNSSRVDTLQWVQAQFWVGFWKNREHLPSTTDAIQHKPNQNLNLHAQYIGFSLGPVKPPSNSPSSEELYRPLLCKLPHALKQGEICNVQQLQASTAKNKDLKSCHPHHSITATSRWRKPCHFTYRNSGRTTSKFEGAWKTIRIFSSMRFYKNVSTEIFGSSSRKLSLPPSSLSVSPSSHWDKMDMLASYQLLVLSLTMPRSHRTQYCPVNEPDQAHLH